MRLFYHLRRNALAFASMTLVIIACLMPSASADQKTPDSQSPVEITTNDLAVPKLTGDMIRQYLLQNPEVIIEALEILDSRRNAEQQASRSNLIESKDSVLMRSDNHAIIGNPEGTVTLIEFFDYNCGFCRQAMPHIDELIKNDGDLRVILKEFPVLGQGSQEAARVALAVLKTAPEKYHALHRALLSVNGQVNEAVALSIAARLEINVEEIKKALEDPAINDGIQEVYDIATELGLTGTPTFVIGKEILPGAVGVESLRQKIAALRKCGETICS